MGGLPQLHHYWKQYEYDGATFQVDGDSVSIDVFAIATQFSPEGRLFPYDSEDDGPKGDDREKGFRQTHDGEPWNNRPQYQFARTEAIPGILRQYAWMEAEKRQDSERSEIDTGIGVLLSDILDDNPNQNKMTDFLSEDSISSTAPKVHWYDGEREEDWDRL